MLGGVREPPNSGIDFTTSTGHFCMTAKTKRQRGFCIAGCRIWKNISKGLSAEDQAAWEHVSRSEEEGRLSETALIFFEVLASEDKERALEQKLMAFHMGMFTVPVDHVIQDWETLEPVVMHVHASAETGQLRHALEQYQLQPTSESAAAASAMVEALINGGREENVSFIGMTAGVGGFIIAVLFYVGILKHPARSKIRHTIKERNS